MSKRKKIFELIDQHVENPHVQQLITEYISNLHSKINDLNESLDKKKKRVKPRRTKRMTANWKEESDDTRK
jgi:glutamate synthase domain-containing protein 3